MPRLFPAVRPCPCGSGEPRRDLRDAHNVFCAFVCDACDDEKRAHFDSRIFTADPYPADERLTED